jgi:GxxExxY protein
MTYLVLPPAVERLTHTVIGCALAVHRELGPGFLESIYRAAMAIELSANGVPFEVERPLVVNYRGHPIGGQRVDLLVGGEVVVELKAVSAIDPIHIAQILSYLKALNIRVGLLINFHEVMLRDGIRRILL